MAKYDVAKLDELGARRTQLRAELKEIAAQLDVEVPKAARAGIIQAEIARRTGLTRESVSQLCLPQEQRWKRGQK